MKRRHFLASATLPFVPGAALLAETGYPSKPIRMVVGYAPGGATDLLARLMADKLSGVLGQPVIVENRPGASGNIGTEMTARAPADGYTLMMGAAAQIATNPSLFRNLRFNPLTELAPITQLQLEHNVLVVNPSLPVRTLQEFIAYAQAHRGKLSYSSAGAGSPGHLAFATLSASDDLQMPHIPYKGTGPSVSDVIAGHITGTIDSMVVLLPHIRAGKLKALAVLSDTRAKVANEIPTARELGRPDMVFTSWKGLFAPRGTPSALLERLHRTCVQILATDEIREKLQGMGAEPLGSSPTEFSTAISSEAKKWAEVVKISGVALE